MIFNVIYKKSKDEFKILTNIFFNYLFMELKHDLWVHRGFNLNNVLKNIKKFFVNI